MILYEVLRLYPPLISIGWFIHKEMKVGNLTIPAGVEQSLVVLLVHHDRELWGEDAQEFEPERFSEGISKVTNNRVMYFQFGWGPQICIRMNFCIDRSEDGNGNDTATVLIRALYLMPMLRQQESLFIPNMVLKSFCVELNELLIP
ncbi:hypothetical protein CDL15_Pgr002431 [Punica granatum]|uniref:Cytochrome P450 CYP72A219-like n=1 Tax=Punica granatum TaxID=22663 RepID=A0A218XUN2_PUNGR|nr:hypothetical protein CDL15_Pgr002431 [Punica granatum]PKI37624.1 hypothetical protein CRG98_041917 [Punica granatum]